MRPDIKFKKELKDNQSIKYLDEKNVDIQDNMSFQYIISVKRINKKTIYILFETALV